jgi:hypothetical protein
VRREVQDGRAAWVLEQAASTRGQYGTWMRAIDPGAARGRRVRLTATLRTKGATRRVDFWARAQAKNAPPDSHGLSGEWRVLPENSDWIDDTIVLDVPEETASLQYGVGVAGPGQVWIDRVRMEVVGEDVPLTSPSNRPPAHWEPGGDDAEAYAIGSDANVKRGGHASGTIRALAGRPRGFATLSQWFSGMYQGKRVRFTAYVRTEGVAGWAGLWMRVDRPGIQPPSAYDRMEDRPIRGTHDWTRYEVVLDVAQDAADVAFGVHLAGPGQVWIDDAAFEVVDASVPTTGRKPPGPRNLDFEQ